MQFIYCPELCSAHINLSLIYLIGVKNRKKEKCNMKKTKMIAAVMAVLLVGGAYTPSAGTVYVKSVSCITVDTDEFTKPESFTGQSEKN